jgi:hypothetical protein
VGTNADVIAPPPGELFSETNANSVVILTMKEHPDVTLGQQGAEPWLRVCVVSEP